MLCKIAKLILYVKKIIVVFKNPYKSEDEIIKYQERLLTETVSNAFNNVSYYRELYGSLSIDCLKIKTVEDLQKLPIITKNDIRSNHDSVLSSICNIENCNRMFTSGSTGSRLEVVVDKEVSALYRLTQLRQLVGLGYKPFDRMAYMRPFPPAGKFSFQKLGLFRRYYVSSLSSPAIQLEAIKNNRLQVLFAYPSTLYLLAQEVKKQGCADSLAIKFILSNSELLTPGARKFIEDAFMCKVFDEYSCLEFMGIGFECKHQRMHIVSDNVIVEVVDENDMALPLGKKGRLIVTALNNRAMPYIRYEIGDIGSLSNEKCECGINYPTFQELMGRNDDFLIMADGSLVPPREICLKIRTVPGVIEFQVIQQSINEITINIVIASTSYKQEVISSLEKKVRDIVGNSPVINVEIVDFIDRGETGKLRAVISLAKKFS